MFNFLFYNIYCVLSQIAWISFHPSWVYVIFIAVFFTWFETICESMHRHSFIRFHLCFFCSFSCLSPSNCVSSNISWTFSISLTSFENCMSPKSGYKVSFGQPVIFFRVPVQPEPLPYFNDAVIVILCNRHLDSFLICFLKCL